MARALLVGCGCRARSLGRTLLDDGWMVRGTARAPGALAEIEAAGIEPALADPDRIADVLELIADVTVICWLLGSARGEPEEVAALHGSRLERLLEEIVDTPVRGVVYEASGSVDGKLLEAGAAIVAAAEERWRIPGRVIDADPADEVAWLQAARAAVHDAIAA